MADPPQLPGTLQNVIDQTELKWIFVGGKGGVGKTTCSCSLAVQLAAVRESVLIISTDPAHNLSDAFRQKFTKQPTLVQGFTNLSAMEVDPTPEDLSAESMDGEGATSFLSDLAGSIPGIDEAMSFAEVMKQVQTMDYSCIVFDTAPTGHTLRLLQFPSLLEKGLAKLVGLRSSFGGLLGQVSGLLGGAGLGDMQEQLMGKLDQLKAVVEEVNAQFKDPDLTTFVCVCIPEFLSLYETERLVQELARFDMDTHNIVVNQVLFDAQGEVSSSRLLSARMRMQQRYLAQFYELYEDFHITLLPLLEDEVRGTDAIREFSTMLLTPYSPPPAKPAGDRVAELEARVAELTTRCADLELQLAAAKKC